MVCEGDVRQDEVGEVGRALMLLLLRGHPWELGFILNTMAIHEGLLLSKRVTRPGLSLKAIVLSAQLRFRSVAQSCLTLRPRGLQHARLPRPSPTPGACSNSCPSNW